MLIADRVFRDYRLPSACLKTHELYMGKLYYCSLTNLIQQIEKQARKSPSMQDTS